MTVVAFFAFIVFAGLVSGGLCAAIILGLIGSAVWHFNSLWVRVPLAATFVATLAIAILFVPEWRTASEHDRFHRRLVARACATEPPPKTRVISCRGEIQHESMGNHCEFAAVLISESRLPGPEVKRYYDKADLGPLVEIRHVSVERDDGAVAVRVDAIGFADESDIRCL